MLNATNIDPSEVAKFSALASRWWDKHGECGPLHAINPLRLQYIDEKACIKGKTVIDIGCGGGILTEAMAGLGAIVTGIDVGAAALQVAKLRQLEIGTQIDYQLVTAEAYAEQYPAHFSVLTCLEMLEHVPDPAAIVRACAALAAPGAHLFFSTLNRNLKSYLQAILGAEYLLQLLPRHTHDYAKFIRPSELDAWARATGLSVQDMIGITYNPLTKQYKLTNDVSVNYLLHMQKM